MTLVMNTKALLSIFAASAVMIATPALAQNYGYGNQVGRDIDRRQARLEERVDRLASNGRIGRAEYRRFDRAFEQFDRLQWSYARNGYSRWEVTDLTNRLDALQDQIRYSRQDDRYDRNDRDDRSHRDDDRRDRRDRDDD